MNAMLCMYDNALFFSSSFLRRCFLYGSAKYSSLPLLALLLCFSYVARRSFMAHDFKRLRTYQWYTLYMGGLHEHQSSGALPSATTRSSETEKKLTQAEPNCPQEASSSSQLESSC